MSATIELGYHPLEFVPCIIQQTQQPQQIDQEKKDQLIQAATSRLRQKLLEQKYQMLMSDIVEVQSKLDVIKLEASISLQSLDSQHLDHFEKKLENHKQQLQSIVSITSSSHPKTEMMLRNKSISSSLSSFSSTISSVFSSFKDKDEEPEDYFAILGHGSQKRRKRSKMTQPSQDNYFEDDTSSISNSSSCCYSNDSNATPITSNSNSVYSIQQDNIKYDDQQSISSLYNMNVKNKVPEIGSKGLLVLHSINSQENGLIKQLEEKDKRNALDDTLSFLDDLASDSDDGGFRQDIIQLLDTIHYDNNCQSELSCRSIPTLKYYKQQTPQPYIHNYNHHHHGLIKSIIHSILTTSWRWLRFALVLTLAILINIRRGPSIF